GQGWAIFEISERAASPLRPDEKNWTQSIIQSNLTYFQAIDSLAQYEAGQEAAIDLGYVRLPGTETADGVPYFRDLAERDGLVFDLNDQLPHPTVEGQIVTSGTFAPSLQTPPAVGKKQETGLNDLFLRAALAKTAERKELDFESALDA